MVCLVLEMFSFPSPSFSFFPQMGGCHEAWSIMCTVNFLPRFSQWHIVIRCPVSSLKAEGSHFTWLWHVNATAVQSMVTEIYVTGRQTLRWAHFDLTDLFLALLCSDWPTWWCGVVGDGRKLMMGYPNLTPPEPWFGCLRQRCPTRLSVSSADTCKWAQFCIYILKLDV
jgi:hypothetical protein